MRTCVDADKGVEVDQGVEVLEARLARGRRDPVTGSCATAADSESAAEDGTPPSSMGTSLMSDP
ncbi:hypothetical protein PI124_g24356 [Phytophthora idaei]|nr:hypothetical protein PI124_g24356 [Phytophthora idaei]